MMPRASLPVRFGTGQTDVRARYPGQPFAPLQALKIKLTTLSDLHIECNGTRLELARQKIRFALLVYLGMERSAPREKVAALLWPDAAESSARGRLKQTIYEIRQTCGHDCIEAKGNALSCTIGLTVDAREFGSLVEIGEFGRALDLYRGCFLDGFHLDGSSEFERWVSRKRAILARTFAQAARSYIRRLLTIEEFDLGVRTASRWIELDDRNEDAHYELMHALTSAGRTGDALSHYAAFEQWLRDEEGVQPSQSLRDLSARIRAGSARAA